MHGCLNAKMREWVTRFFVVVVWSLTLAEIPEKIILFKPQNKGNPENFLFRINILLMVISIKKLKKV